MNQTLKGARYQATGVALKALSNTKDDSRITPITIYSDNLDAGNLIELAIEPEKLADALRMDATDIQAWLKHLEECVAHWATPKTIQQYPRIGVRNGDELKALLDVWDLLVGERRWSTYPPSPTGQVDSVGMAPLDRSRCEKALADHGFDLTPTMDGQWLLGRSTQHPIPVWLGPEAHGTISLANTSEKLRIAMVDEGFAPQHEQRLSGGAGWSISNPDFGSLHRALGRFAALARSLPNHVAERFASATRKLPQSTEAERLVVQRVGQGLFREALIDFWEGRCAVTGLDVVPLLRASHIKPWAACETDDERLDVFNGLLLAPHLDALFDGGWITISEEGKVLISDRLSTRARELLSLHEKAEVGRISHNHQDYLRYHRIEVFR